MRAIWRDRRRSVESDFERAANHAKIVRSAGGSQSSEKKIGEEASWNAAAVRRSLDLLAGTIVREEEWRRSSIGEEVLWNAAVIDRRRRRSSAVVTEEEEDRRPSVSVAE